VAIFQMILFFMGATIGSVLTKATQGDRTAAAPQGTFNVKNLTQRRLKIHDGAPIGAKHAQRSLGGQALRPWVF
jgi:hypothetical protein